MRLHVGEKGGRSRRAGGQEDRGLLYVLLARTAQVPPHTPACAPVCRRVINPLEASNVVGITNYVDIGVQVGVQVDGQPCVWALVLARPLPDQATVFFPVDCWRGES